MFRFFWICSVLRSVFWLFMRVFILDLTMAPLLVLQPSILQNHTVHKLLHEMQTDTPAARHIFHMYSHCTDHTARMHMYMAQVWVCVPKIGHPSTRHVSFCASQYTDTSTSSLSPASPVLRSSSSPIPDLLSTRPFIHCEDPRKDGTSTEFQSPTGYEPKRIELNRILVNPHKKSDNWRSGWYWGNWCHVVVTANHWYIPPDSDLEDEQLRKMPASPPCLQEREENEGQARAYHSERESLMINFSRNPEVSGKPDAECVQKREALAQRTQTYHSKRERLMTSSSRDLEVSGKPDAVFSCHKSSQNTFSERDRSNEPGNRFESSVHFFFQICWPDKWWEIPSWWEQRTFAL